MDGESKGQIDIETRATNDGKMLISALVDPGARVVLAPLLAVNLELLEGDDALLAEWKRVIMTFGASLASEWLRQHGVDHDVTAVYEVNLDGTKMEKRDVN